MNNNPDNKSSIPIIPRSMSQLSQQLQGNPYANLNADQLREILETRERTIQEQSETLETIRKQLVRSMFTLLEPLFMSLLDEIQNNVQISTLEPKDKIRRTFIFSANVELTANDIAPSVFAEHLILLGEMMNTMYKPKPFALPCPIRLVKIFTVTEDTEMDHIGDKRITIQTNPYASNDNIVTASHLLQDTINSFYMLINNMLFNNGYTLENPRFNPRYPVTDETNRCDIVITIHKESISVSWNETVTALKRNAGFSSVVSSRINERIANLESVDDNRPRQEHSVRDAILRANMETGEWPAISHGERTGTISTNGVSIPKFTEGLPRNEDAVPSTETGPDGEDPSSPEEAPDGNGTDGK